MAFRLTAPLQVLGYKDGKPVFALPDRAPAPAVPAQAPPPPQAPRAAAPAAPAAARPARERTNQFPSSCAKCTGTVAKGAGLLERQGDRWVVTHRPEDSACKPAPAAAKQPSPEPTPAPKAAPKVSARGPVCAPEGTKLSKGYFTAQFEEDGEPVYVTLRLKQQADTDRFKPGRLLVGYLRGANNEGDYTNFGDIDDKGRCWIWPRYQENVRLRRAVAAVLGNQKEAGEAWARASQRCWRCGLHLTTPWALDHLVGKDCWEKLQQEL